MADVANHLFVGRIAVETCILFVMHATQRIVAIVPSTATISACVYVAYDNNEARECVFVCVCVVVWKSLTKSESNCCVENS